VLYIEDQPANVRLIQRLLDRRPDVELVTSSLGVPGVDTALRLLPDLILLDLHLPDIAGEEVLARLRSRSETADIPVVVLSADARAERIEGALAAGGVEFLTKPLDLAKVLSVIDHLIERNGPRRHAEGPGSVGNGS
jgi:CheY-like chemotaxis protein